MVFKLCFNTIVQSAKSPLVFLVQMQGIWCITLFPSSSSRSLLPVLTVCKYRWLRVSAFGLISCIIDTEHLVLSSVPSRCRATEPSPAPPLKPLFKDTRVEHVLLCQLPGVMLSSVMLWARVPLGNIRLQACFWLMIKCARVVFACIRENNM